MRVLIFGATGMVGQGVLRECLLADDVAEVVAIGRTPTGQTHPALRDIVHKDLFDYRGLDTELSGFNACFFCLGVSAAGMSEADYSHLTYDLTLAAAQTLARLNPAMVFTYVSGAGTDSSEHGRIMWARVKGRTENALLALPFKGAYMFRPGIIQPLHGARSKTKSYRVFYTLAAPLLGALRALFPNHVLTTVNVARAMLTVARRGSEKSRLEAVDIRHLGDYGDGLPH